MSLSESRTWSPFIEQSMEWFTLELVSLVQGSSSNSSSSSPDEPSAAEHEGKLWQSRARCLNAVALETILLLHGRNYSHNGRDLVHIRRSYKEKYPIFHHITAPNSAILCHTWKQGTGYQYIKTSFVYLAPLPFEEKWLVLKVTMLEQKHVQILKVTGFGLLANANT